MINSILSPKIASGPTPVAPTGLIHYWPLSYGYVYVQDFAAGGTWDFTVNTTWVFNTAAWTTDRDGVGTSSLDFSTINPIITQPSVRTLPVVNTLVIRMKLGLQTTNTIIDQGANLSQIAIRSASIGYQTGFMSGGSVSVTNSPSTYYDFAFVKTDSYVKFYRDGVYLGEYTKSNFSQFNLLNLGVVDNQVDFMQIYDNELTEGNLLYIYQNSY